MRPESPATKDDVNSAMQAVMDEILVVKDDVQGVKGDVGMLKALTLGSPDPDQHNYVIFPIGGSFLGSCSGCAWQRGARVVTDIHEMFQQHHSEFLDGWQESDPGEPAG